MKVSDVIVMLERKLANLSQLITSAAALGDVSRVGTLEAEHAETLETLNKLQSVQ